MSIIIPTLNEGVMLERTVHNIIDTLGLDNYDYEIIIINSGGTEMSAIKKLRMVHIYDSVSRLGVPQAKNLGASKAAGDFLVFIDAHLQFEENWASKILKDLETKETIITPCITVMNDKNHRGFGFKWRNVTMDREWLPYLRSSTYEIPFGPGACMGMTKKFFHKIGQFDSGIRCWGEEDAEISIRAWLFGYSVMCDPLIVVGHLFRQFFCYGVNSTDIAYNKLRLALSYFSYGRLTKYLNETSNTPFFNNSLAMALKENVFNRRTKLFRNRVNSDEWFFEKFPMRGLENKQ